MKIQITESDIEYITEGILDKLFGKDKQQNTNPDNLSNLGRDVEDAKAALNTQNLSKNEQNQEIARLNAILKELQQFTQTALSYEGMRKGDTRYNNEFRPAYTDASLAAGDHKKRDIREQPWCCAFVMAMLHLGELDYFYNNNALNNATAYVPTLVKQMRNAGFFIQRENNPNYIPKESDLIVFYWGKSDRRNTGDHIGIVYKYDPNLKRIYTIEGNAQNGRIQSQATCREYKLNDTRILGYVNTLEVCKKFHPKVDAEPQKTSYLQTILNKIVNVFNSAFK